MTSLGALIVAAVPGVVESDVFGTTDPVEIASMLAALVEKAIGVEVSDGLWYQSSVAAVAGLRLDDGRMVVVHAYRHDVTPGFVDGVVRVQGHLAEVGFPSARPLSGPVSVSGLIGRVESLRPDAGHRRFAPHEMRASAQGLARLVHLAAAVESTGLDAHPMSLPEAQLYPAPHSPLFDFAATAVGAQWIDDIATAAREQMATDTPVIAHSDWSARNVRLDSDGLACVYDWESLQIVPEATAAGIAAATWRYVGTRDEPVAPTPTEIQQYVDQYEDHREMPFTPTARRGAHAAAVYALAYTARCEHAVSPGTTTGRASGRLTNDGLQSLLYEGV